MTADEAADWAALDEAEIGQRVRTSIRSALNDGASRGAQDSVSIALKAARQQRAAGHALDHVIPGYGGLK